MYFSKMYKYKNYLNKFGWPIKTTPNFKIEKRYESKVFFFSKLKRKFDICLKIPSFELIDRYYGDKFSDSFYINNLQKIRLFKIINIKINLKVLSKLVFYISKKKVIKLKKNEICLFGPYSQNYNHVIHEFFIRLIFLNSQKNLSTIWLPDNLKIYLNSHSYKKTFSYLKFKYYSTQSNTIFLNCNYLTHANNRWIIRNGKKKLSYEYVNLLNNLKKKVYKNHFFRHDKTYKYIIVSRSNAKQRKLINEKELLKRLEPYGFKLVHFEKYNHETQINIARNCKIMIGYHGAGLTNSIYMSQKSLVIEIFNKNYEHECFKLFSTATKINCKRFKCVKSYSNLDGVCDVNKIVSYVNKKLRQEKINK